MLCGARLTYNYVRIGGVAADVTEGFIEKIRASNAECYACHTEAGLKNPPRGGFFASMFRRR